MPTWKQAPEVLILSGFLQVLFWLMALVSAALVGHSWGARLFARTPEAPPARPRLTLVVDNLQLRAMTPRKGA